MKKILIAIAAVVISSAANAADMPVKAPVYKAVASDWSGFYAGINGGYGWGSSSQHSNVIAPSRDPSDGSYNLNGGFVGGTLGYNWQITNWLLGVEGDYAWSGIKGSTTCDLGTTCGTNIRSFGTLRGRLGIVNGNWLVYGTGGWAFANVNAYDLHDPASGTAWRNGWAAGVGAEYKFSGPWSAKVEYIYMDFGTKSQFTNANHTPEDINVKANLIRAGINYRF